MLSRPSVRSVILSLLCLTLHAGCGTKEVKPDRKALLEKGLNDTSIPDEQALILIAQGTFRELESASTLPPVKGKVMTIVNVHGQDVSSLSGSIVEKAGSEVGTMMRKIQFVGVLRDLDRFIKEGRKRNLGDLTFTLKTPTVSEGKVEQWIDTYRFKLPEKAFDRYLQTDSLESEQRLLAAQRLWKVELDEFSKFRYGTK